MEKVCVLMSTYNGEKYLRQQIESVLRQINVKVELHIRDDGSTDNTCKILKEYGDRYKNVNWQCGENYGPARSFWSMVKKSSYDAKYYAFCDQDDIWLDDKLFVAVEKLKLSEKPSLYYSNTLLVDENGRTIKKNSNKLSQKTIPSFPQLIMENVATGCTMVWNSELNNIARTFSPAYIRMHDHLLILLCMYCGGEVLFDNEAHILYRQHGGNVIGGEKNLKKYGKSIVRFLKNKSGLAKQAMQLSKVTSVDTPVLRKEFLDELIRYENGENNLRYMYSCMKQRNLIKNIMIWGVIYLRRL